MWEFYANELVNMVIFFFFEKKVKMLFEMVITYYWLKKSILHRVFQKYTCLKCLEIALAP
jgi:hypothetical protein